MVGELVDNVPVAVTLTSGHPCRVLRNLFHGRHSLLILRRDLVYLGRISVYWPLTSLKPHVNHPTAPVLLVTVIVIYFYIRRHSLEA